MRLAIVVAPTAYDRIDLIDQLLHRDRSLPPCESSNLILEAFNRLLTGYGIKVIRVRSAMALLRR